MIDEHALASHLGWLRQLPFIRGLELAWEPRLIPPRPDAVLKLKTPRRTFRLGLATKGTFLDQSLTNAVIAEHIALVRGHRLPLLLAARYIPRPTGERLAAAGVNFVDRPGNIHLKLGDAYHMLLLGRRERSTEPTARRIGPALIQLYFVLLAEPAAADWPVRKLADAAGIGKTAAATGRQRLVRLGVVARARHGAHRVTDRDRLADEFITGYARILRPHLLLGRFRAPERDPATLLKHIALAARDHEVDWAVTGGPGAYALERFYRGAEVPVLITPFKPDLQRALRLVPDRHGPLTFLRAFGHRWMWRAVGDLRVAHPWLVYAELLNTGDPRALEAAGPLRDAYLKT